MKSMNKYIANPRFELTNTASHTVYEIMHLEKTVATISNQGEAHILNDIFMPFDLYLEEGTEWDILLNNTNNFCN